MFKPKPRFYVHACDVVFRPLLPQSRRADHLRGRTRKVAYTYNAETLCPHCTLKALPTGEGQAFDGWQDMSGQPVEDSLTELALAFGIDRDDESSFDSSEFPKVVFVMQIDGAETCDACGEELV